MTADLSGSISPYTSMVEEVAEYMIARLLAVHGWGRMDIGGDPSRQLGEPGLYSNDGTDWKTTYDALEAVGEHEVVEFLTERFDGLGRAYLQTERTA